MIEITRTIAEKVRDTVDAGLVYGVGEPTPGKMCVEAAVCYALGLPHGDDPDCVSAPLRSLKIRLNDSKWTSSMTRAAGLRRLAVAQLGSKGVLDDKKFVHLITEMTIRTVVPMVLRTAAKKNPGYATAFEEAAVRCEVEGTREAALFARNAAYAASADAAEAAYTASAAAAAASTDAAVYAAVYTDKHDSVLANFAEAVVQILIQMKAPGCQWLDLVPLEKA